MADTDSTQPDETKHPTDYERTDAHIGGIVACGVALAAITALVLVAMVWMFDGLARQDGAPRASSVAANGEPATFPPAPRLEGLPPAPQMEAEAERLAAPQEYRWVDRKKQIVQIPIEEAMKLLANKLPARAANSAAAAGELAAERSQPPGASSSGRIVPGEKIK